MGNELLVYVGTYTEPIRFGTGQILQGKGQGIYLFKLDMETGAMKLLHKTFSVANPSYLTLSPSKKILYAVNVEQRMAHCRWQGQKSCQVGWFPQSPAPRYWPADRVVWKSGL